MKGRVKFYKKDKNGSGYGFIVDSETGAEIFFGDLSADLIEIVKREDQVTFEIGTGDFGDQHYATHIRIAEVVADPEFPAETSEPVDTRGRLHGIVEEMAANKQFFFIMAADGRGQVQKFFGDWRNVQRDKLGCRNLDIGSQVSFIPGIAPDAKQRPPALEILNEDPALEEIDLASHREWGQVLDFDGYKHGYIQRGDADSKDRLDFYIHDVISEGAANIQIGDWLLYGVRCRDDQNGKVKWVAVNIQTAVTDDSPEEIQPPKEGEVYNSFEKTLSLRELIQRKVAVS